MKYPRISWEIGWSKTALIRPSPQSTPFFSWLLDIFLQRTEWFFFRLGYLLHVLYRAEAMKISRTVIIE
jgi:hypothetical protein